MSNQAITKATAAGVAATSNKKDIRSLLEGDAFKQEIARALPKHLPPDRFIRIALTAMTRTPKLKECDPASFFEKLLTLSQLGIEPDGNRAYLIPFENRKRGCVECQLIVSYKGLVELAMRSGNVSNIHADCVCESDVFEYDRGEIKTHKIDFRKPRGEAYAAYCICRFKDGTEKAEVMSREDIEGIRMRSKAANNGPWQSDWREMAKKTVARRLLKWIPASPEYRDSIEADDDTIDVSASQVTRPVFEIPASTLLPEPEPAPKDVTGKPEPSDNDGGANDSVTP